jgi:hypothetical protein
MYRIGILPDADQSMSLRQSGASLPLLNLKKSHFLLFLFSFFQRFGGTMPLFLFIF